MDKKLEQMVEDLEKILNLFKKMENSSIEDVDTLKKESILIREELKERYDKQDPPETDPQET
jgi:Asp-tRNA(Asn)/Glu-tRNA(Gln) amidotransferase C subunit